MQLILNPFEIEIRKKSLVPITYEAFFPPIFKNATEKKKRQIHSVNAASSYCRMLFSVLFHNIAEIKGSKIILWRFGASDHLNRTVFFQKQFC